MSNKPKVHQVEALTYSDSFESEVDRHFRNRPVHRVEDAGPYNIDRIVQDFGSKLFRSRQARMVSPSGLTERIQWATLCFALEEDLFVTLMSVTGAQARSEGLHYKATVTSSTPQKAVECALAWRKAYLPPSEEARPSFFIMTGRRVESAPLEEKHKLNTAQLDLHYGEGFAAWSEQFLAGLNDPGISLLCGETGTGKTSYIRHAMSALSATHRFYFVPVDNFNLLSSGSLTEFWKGEQREHPQAAKVLVLEDAESIMLNREASSGNSVSSLLNLTDGLMTQFVRVHLLGTLNCKREMLDKALLRPGRLKFFRDFPRLSSEHARRIASHYGHRLGEGSDYSIAEIFASEKFAEHTKGAQQPKAPIGFGFGASA